MSESNIINKKCVIVEWEGSPPGVFGKIPNDEKIFTDNGYRHDEVLSQFRISIRNGDIYGSLFWTKCLFSKNKRKLIRNIRKILCEDIGIANSILVKYVNDYLMDYKDSKNEFILYSIIKALCLSPKSRMCYNLVNSVMESNSMYKYENYKTQKFTGKYKDTKKFVTYMNNFVHSMEKEDPKEICYWIQKIFSIKKKQSKRDKLNGSSHDPIYAIWKYLRESNICGFRDDTEILINLEMIYSQLKNGRTERLPVVHAILHMINKNKIRETIWQNKNNFDLTKKEIEFIKNNKKLKIQDHAINIKTKRGKKRSKTIEDFWDKCLKIPGYKDQYENEAKNLLIQRYNEGLKGFKRSIFFKKKKRRRENDIYRDKKKLKKK